MKNWIKYSITISIFFLHLSLVLVENSFSQETEEKINNLSNLSQEAIKQIKLEQNLTNLESSDYHIFEGAVWNFVKNGESSITPLLGHLKNNQDDKKITNAVIYTLGRLGKKSERAVPIIISYLHKNDYDTKVTAVSALGKVGLSAEKAIPILRTYLYQDGDWLTDITLRTLKDIGTPEAVDAVQEYKKFKLLKMKEQ